MDDGPRIRPTLSPGQEEIDPANPSKYTNNQVDSASLVFSAPRV
jgi:hypothetical protein